MRTLILKLAFEQRREAREPHQIFREEEEEEEEEEGRNTRSRGEWGNGIK